MRQTSFEKFIRFGGTKTFILKTGSHPGLVFKQETPSTGDVVRDWVDDVWSRTFGATSQAILKTEPFEFSAAGLSGIDQETLRADATEAVRSAMEREGIDFISVEWEQRALAVLTGFLNQAQQEAMGIEFYVWVTQNDARVRGSHADRDDKIFRWDTPPEGGHPSQDFGCRCYARPLGKEGYWQRVEEGVDTFTSHIADWEGSVDHMYLDSADNVTVGQGKLLNTAEDAVALPFRDRASGNPASKDEIRDEFDIIDAMEGSQDIPASDYEPYTLLYLTESEVDRLVIDHMKDDFDDMLRLFPDFGNFPLSAQVALWDMIYNLGPGKLKSEFPMMLQAIEDGKWAEAAEQSHRKGPSEERNQFVYDLFMDAAEGP